MAEAEHQNCSRTVLSNRWRGTRLRCGPVQTPLERPTFAPRTLSNHGLPWMTHHGSRQIKDVCAATSALAHHGSPRLKGGKKSFRSAGGLAVACPGLLSCGDLIPAAPSLAWTLCKASCHPAAYRVRRPGKQSTCSILVSHRGPALGLLEALPPRAGARSVGPGGIHRGDG